jgi:hypothetical protein
MVNMKGMKNKTGNLFVSVGCALILLMAARGAWGGSSSSEQALRARAEKLYALIQAGDWAKAEKFVAKDSKAMYKNQRKRPILAYRIFSVKIDPSGDKATVVMQIPVRTPFASQPVVTSQTSFWRLEHGTWYFEYPHPDAKATESLFDPQAQPPKATVPQGTIRPPRHGSSDLKFDSTWAGLGYIHPGEVKVAQFHFTNTSQHPVKLVEVETDGKCLKLKSPLKEYQAGEKGVLELEMDPSALGLNSEQALNLTVTVKTEPDSGIAMLTVGAVFEPQPEPKQP